MATLTVWTFDDPDSAETMRARVLGLQDRDLIQVHDAVVVSWPVDDPRPRTDQLVSTKGAGAASGAFWGLLFGLIFFVPFFGMAFGAAMGALGGALTDLGIDDHFIESVRDEVTPGTSALFLMSSDAVLDEVKDQLSDLHPELVSTNLSVDDEDALRELFEG